MGGDPREQESGTAVMKQRRESNSNCLQGMLDTVRPSEDPCEMYLEIAYGQKEETWFHVSHWSKVALTPALPGCTCMNSRWFISCSSTGDALSDSSCMELGATLVAGVRDGTVRI